MPDLRRKPGILDKTIRYLRYYAQLDKRGKRIEIARRFFPSIQLQYKLDDMAGPVGYWSEIQAYQIGTVRKLGLQPHHRLLDLGCGPLRGGLGFIRYLDAGHYTGIDLREESIAEAHMQIAREGLAAKNPFLVVSDSFGQKELNGHKFDYIWCSQLLYHLDERQVNALLRQVSRLLTPKGKFYGDIIGYPNAVKKDSQWNGFPFHLHRVDVLKKIAARHRLAVAPMGQIESYGYPSQIRLKTNELLEFSRKQIPFVARKSYRMGETH